ncbi:hypothetical protein J7643_16115 [bacterium]|nr:hypothetical protein [bacterium]
MILKRSVAFALIACAFFPAPALAWADHDLLTREILREVKWLNQYRAVKVTPYTYAEQEKAINPDYKPVYLDKLVGETTNAREIMIRYADEPDWGLDDGIEASPLQSLTGGSKGYRHQSYQLANGVVKLGEAPKRVKAYYDLARVAFNKQDYYWGFRFLTRSVHYLEDMGQPYHTKPILWRQILDAKLDTKRLGTLATNLHTYYEAYVSHHLRKQAAKGHGKWIGAIQDAKPADVFDPEAAAVALADFANARAPELMDALDRFWPKRVKSSKTLQPIRVEDLEPAEPPPSFGTIDEITTLDLHVTSKMVRGLMALAKRDLLAPRPEAEE